MVDDHINHDKNAPIVSRLHKGLEILGGSKPRIQLCQVIDPVSMVSNSIWGVDVEVLMNRANPDRSEATNPKGFSVLEMNMFLGQTTHPISLI